MSCLFFKLILSFCTAIICSAIFLMVDKFSGALTNFAEFRYFSIAGGRILDLMKESEMQGSEAAPESGDIRLEHVSFGYGHKEVLRDISVPMKQGSLTALVGPSGSGKSSLMKICARFYNP